MVHTVDGNLADVVIGDCQSLLEQALWRLGNVGNTNSLRCHFSLLDVFFQSMLCILELALDTVQSTTRHIMVLAKMVGITLCNSLIIMVCGNDGHCLLGTRLGGLATYIIGLDMDGRATQTNNTF
jgi:hypothetical protein